MVSTMSAWCSASRAAHEIASEGMLRASGSRWRGRRLPAPGCGSASQRSTVRPTSPVKPMKTTARTRLKARWKPTICWCTEGSSCCSRTCTCGRKTMKRTAPSRLEDQVAERQPPHLRRGVAGGEHGEDAAADVGADHQAERHRHRDHAGGGEGGDQQHHRQAGIGQHRQHRADDDVEQDLVRQGDEQGPDLGRFGQRPGRGDDQLQRQGDQPEADQHPAEGADAAVLARDEDDHADEDQERRQPRQVEREHHRHDGWCRRRRRASPPGRRWW